MRREQRLALEASTHRPKSARRSDSPGLEKGPAGSSAQTSWCQREFSWRSSIADESCPTQWNHAPRHSSKKTWQYFSKSAGIKVRFSREIAMGIREGAPLARAQARVNGPAASTRSQGPPWDRTNARLPPRSEQHDAHVGRSDTAYSVLCTQYSVPALPARQLYS